MENEVVGKKDTTKEKIVLFVIGVLVGAVIATVAFFVCVKTLGVGSSTSETSSQQMPGGGTPPEMPSGESGSQNGQGGTPPELPSGENSQGGQNGQSGENSQDGQNGQSGQNSQSGTPPEKPSSDNNSQGN